MVATELLSSGFEFDQGSVIFNRFRWGVSSGLGGCVFSNPAVTAELTLTSLPQVCHLLQDGPEATVLHRHRG